MESMVSKPPSCPKCRSGRTVAISYGLPTEDAFKDPNFVGGGCCIDDDSPQWACRDCKHQWGRWDDPEILQ